MPSLRTALACLLVAAALPARAQNATPAPPAFETFALKRVEKSYRTEPFRVLHGHSFGGMFALYTLWARSELFQARIAVAPTLTWNGDEPVRKVKELVAARKDLSGVLVVTGGRGEDERGRDAVRRVGALRSSRRRTCPSPP